VYFYRARYYDAELWRFISQDPIGISDDINLYNYVGGNPVNWADPLGLEKKILLLNVISDDDYRSAMDWKILTYAEKNYLKWDENIYDQKSLKHWNTYGAQIGDNIYYYRNITTIEELQWILNMYKNGSIVEIYIYWHWDPYSLHVWNEYMTNGTFNQDYKTIKDMNDLKTIRIYACNTWKSPKDWKQSYAQDLSDYLKSNWKNIDIYAPNWYALPVFWWVSWWPYDILPLGKMVNFK